MKKRELDVFFEDSLDEAKIHDLARQVAQNISEEDQNLDSGRYFLDLSKTALYTTVFLVDDSTSVKENKLDGPLMQALMKATEMATAFKFTDRNHKMTAEVAGRSSSDVIVRFLNNKTTQAMDRVSGVSDMRAILQKIKWKGGTEIGTMLQQKVLEPLVLEKARKGTLQQPVLVNIITDGKVITLFDCIFDSRSLHILNCV